MLSAATGTITIIDTHLIDFAVGPITLAVSVANAALFDPQKIHTLFLYTHWHQENGPTLFGFTDTTEKTLFSLILSCSGIGPKIALSLMGQLSPDIFIEAVQSGNSAILSKVPGIGAKKAEQIIFSIKSKIAKLLESGIIIPQTTAGTVWHTVHQALTSLNYSQPEIQYAMEQTKTQLGEKKPNFDHLMRIALSALSKKK